MLIDWILPGIAVLSLVEFLVFVLIDFPVFDFFNPIDNYREWTSLNWFGVIFLPLCIILFVLYMLCYIGFINYVP